MDVFLILGGVAIFCIFLQLALRKIDKGENGGKRNKGAFSFCDGISEQDFKLIVNEARKWFPRFNYCYTEGPKVMGSIHSVTNLSSWTFVLDFNDGGHLTGYYTLNSTNKDSRIPEAFGEKISEYIKTFPKIKEEIFNKSRYVNNYRVAPMFCQFCGNRLANSEQKFCAFCGNRLR